MASESSEDVSNTKLYCLSEAEKLLLFSSSKCKAVRAFLPKHFINLCAWSILSLVHICELRVSTSTRPSTSVGYMHEVSTSASTSTRKRSILWLSCLFRCAVWTSVKQAQTTLLSIPVHSARAYFTFSCAYQFTCVNIPSLCLFLYLCLSHKFSWFISPRS